MNTPLQNASLAQADLTEAVQAPLEEEFGGESHIHMPNPSLWPLLTAIPVGIFMIGIFFVNSAPLISIVGAGLTLVSIIFWGIENPFAPRHGEGQLRPGQAAGFASTYADAASTGRITPLAAQTLQDAQYEVDRTVTISSTAYSAHPVTVEIEREGVVLALYGKVELEAQKKELEDRLLQMPGVIDVKDFLVAEDALLNAVNGTIERLKSSGKLEGARDISALVENYIVSLYGYVPNPEMKGMLEKQIVAVPGVRVVINHIGLNEDIPGNLGHTRNR